MSDGYFKLRDHITPAKDVRISLVREDGGELLDAPQEPFTFYPVREAAIRVPASYQTYTALVALAATMPVSHHPRTRKSVDTKSAAQKAKKRARKRR